MQLPRAPQDTAVMQIPGTFFFFSFFCLFTNFKKKAIIINPNKDTQLAATFRARFGGTGIYKPTAETGTPARSCQSFRAGIPSHPKKPGGHDP